MVCLFCIIILSLLSEYQVSAFPPVTANLKHYTVDVDFPNNTDCCVHESACRFNSLYSALKCMVSHTVVTILSRKVTLTSSVNISPCTNVTIVGLTHATVSCKNSSYILFYKSHDIVIKSITWSNCGLNGSLYIGQLNCNYCSNLSIINSVFQNSSSVGVAFIGVDGNIIVQGSIFKFNSGNKQAGGMLISTDTGKVNTFFNLIINMSNFYSNNAFCFNDLQCSGGLYVSIPSDSTNIASLHIERSNFTFHNASGSGAVFITADGGKLTVNISDVVFSNNFGKLAGALYLYVTVLSSLQDYAVGSINITSCSFTSNYAYDGVVVIHNIPDIVVQYSEFNSNNASGLYVLQSHITHVGHIVFQRNSASSGGGIALMKGSLITLGNNTYLEFSNNFAVRYGGAVYAEIPFCNGIQVMNGSKPIILFVNNSAGIAGDSVYFQIPNSCESTSEEFNMFLSSLHCLHCIGINGNTSINNDFPCYEYMRSSPINLVSNDTSNCNSRNDDCFFDINVMLGEEIAIPLKVIDYFNQTAEPTVFLVASNTNGYKLEGSSSKYTIIQNGFNGINIVGNDPSYMSVKNITIDLSTVEVRDTTPITLHLKLSLTGCHTGFVYNKKQSKCVCFSKYGILHCINNVYSMIGRGYWFGYVKVKGKMVASLSICPNNYCKFVKCNSDNNNMCMLHPNLQQQCHAHRTGVACSKCEASYTLSYDSTVCISNKQCTAGHTALVVILTMFYWIIIIGVVFVVLSFKLRVNYLFAIIYFYSIVDLLIGNNLYISDEVFQTVTVLSSFAKLSPQFLGKLCLVEGMSGIDQLFIHYSHPIAILVMLIVITVVARNSLRVSNFISSSIIRVICLLLLLSYTSIASTSLLLLRHLKFTDIDGVYTYLSPEIKFFHGRHILYGGVAMLCELIIGIGLPLLLILDPFVSYKINLVKIRPLLDQFQGGYKDKYRWCAAYYLICRQIIFLIVYLTTVHNYEQMNFVLLVVCAAITMFHAWIQPYAEEGLNSLDEVILVSSVVIVGLNEAAFSTEFLAKMIVGFVFFPLLSFAGFLLPYSSIKRKIVDIFVYVVIVLHCGAMQQKSNIQDDGVLDNYNQYDRSNDSDDENQPLLTNHSSGSILRDLTADT